MNSQNYLLCGVGGQGTVLAAKILANAGLLTGEEVKTTETIGMAQRGGSVVSHVRIGKNIHSPLLPPGSADVIIGFEPAEAVRNLSYLSPDGTVIVSLKAVKPVTAALSGSSYDGSEMISFLKKTVKNIVVIDAEEICRECGSSRILNVALLGAALGSGALDISQEAIEQSLKKCLPEKLHKINRKALERMKERTAK